jgi:glycerophosphoryl diester phosphodiesterase
MARRLPLNLAHRGARRVAPENTIPAFLKALALGADGIELDVQLSRDGEMVVIHDFTLERTTSGAGPVAAQRLEELRALDAGAWFGGEWAGTQIPTLADVFDALPSHAYVNVELKYDGVRSNGLEQAIAAFISERDLFERVLVSSFNPFMLGRLRRIDPRIPIGLLFAPDMPPGLRHGELARWLRPDALHPHFSQVRPSLISSAHALGRKLNTWTVNDPEVMRLLVEWQVDAIITDVPDLLAALLREIEGGAGA